MKNKSKYIYESLNWKSSIRDLCSTYKLISKFKIQTLISHYDNNKRLLQSLNLVRVNVLYSSSSGSSSSCCCCSSFCYYNCVVWSHVIIIEDRNIKTKLGESKKMLKTKKFVE